MILHLFELYAILIVCFLCWRVVLINFLQLHLLYFVPIALSKAVPVASHGSCLSRQSHCITMLYITCRVWFERWYVWSALYGIFCLIGHTGIYQGSQSAICLFYSINHSNKILWLLMCRCNCGSHNLMSHWALWTTNLAEGFNIEG